MSKVKEIKKSAEISDGNRSGGTSSYGGYLQSRLEVEYGIKYDPELAQKNRENLEEAKEQMKKLKEQGKLPCPEHYIGYK